MRILVVGVTAFLILGLFSLSFSQESITITTYYPSPFGSYNQLTTAGDTYLATTSGNVGIGTTAPGAKLHVTGNTLLDNNQNLQFKDAAGNIGGIAMVNTSDEIYLGDYNNQFGNNLYIQTSGNPRVTILPGGNVGIGTTSPLNTLHLRQGDAILRITDTNPGGNDWGLVSAATLVGKFGLYDYTDGAYRIVVDTDGNVGIGTASPLSTLAIYKSGGGNNFQIGINNPNTGSTDEAARTGIKLEANAADAYLVLFGSNYAGGWGSNFADRLVLFGGSGASGVDIVSSADDIRFYSGGYGIGNERMRILSGGNVGIGTASPSDTLTVNGSTWCTSGAWVGSDLRWKRNVKMLKDPLHKLLRLRGVEYDWKREDFKGNNFPAGRQIGIVAQELEKEFPELVNTNKDGYKAVAYDKFTAVLLEAIKSQQKEIDNLKREITGLKVQLKSRDKQRK